MAEQATITKTEAVRQAFAKLGNDAAADAVMTFVKDTYAMDLSKAHFYTIRNTLSKMPKKRGRPRKVAAEAAAAPVAAPKFRNAISLDDLQSIKALSQKYGTQSVRSLIDLVAK